MELVALLDSNQSTLGQVTGVINREEWDNIILIGDSSTKNFNNNKDFEFIEIQDSPITDLKDQISSKLKGKIKGTEVALSIAGGTGKQHMALISALLSSPVGIRFTVLTKDGLVFM